MKKVIPPLNLSLYIFRILPTIVIQSRNTLVHLIADGNVLSENSFNMPMFPRLRTLSIDANKVSFRALPSQN